MKNKIITIINIVILIIGILLTVLPTFLTSENQIWQINLDTKIIQYTTAMGILIIIINMIIFLFFASLQKSPHNNQ